MCETMLAIPLKNTLFEQFQRRHQARRQTQRDESGDPSDADQSHVHRRGGEAV